MYQEHREAARRADAAWRLEADLACTDEDFEDGENAVTVSASVNPKHPTAPIGLSAATSAERGQPASAPQSRSRSPRARWHARVWSVARAIPWARIDQFFFTAALVVTSVLGDVAVAPPVPVTFLGLAADQNPVFRTAAIDLGDPRAEAEIRDAIRDPSDP